MLSYNEARFRQQVDSALVKIGQILTNERNVAYAAEVFHQYNDKFMLAEFLTTTIVSSILNILENLGLGRADLEQLKTWSQTSSITLCLKAEESCVYDRTVVRDAEVESRSHTSTFMSFTAKSKIVTKVNDNFYKYKVEYHLCAYQGKNVDTTITLQKRSGAMELVTNSDDPPYPKVKIFPPVEVDLSWLLSQVSPTIEILTPINRQNRACLTPLRNPEISAALQSLTQFSEWSNAVSQYFENHLFQVELSQEMINPDMSVLSKLSNIFIPIVPLFNVPQVLQIEPGDLAFPPPLKEKPLSKVLNMEDTANFLYEQQKGLSEKYAELAKVFPALVNKKVVSVIEAKTIVTLKYAQQAIQQYSDSVNYIEQMLFSQLRAAIGKEVKASDFGDYIKYHNRKLFRNEYQPSPFSYAIAKQGGSPEGVVSIEAAPLDGTAILPVQTIVSKSAATKPMKFALNAGTDVSFLGDRFLHGWVSYTFRDDVLPPLTLTARARAFSCFIVMAGRIIGPDLFDPKCALVVRNKDDIQIPLALEAIPTPKEFRDAIDSMSPEQQRFCKAYREMQLSSTLFGLVVLQIKPQLEKILNLPPDSLTKEIQLTQHLLDLFIQYQIPSDLLAFSGDIDAPTSEKVTSVQTQVSFIQSMIKAAKEQVIEEQKLKTQYENPGLGLGKIYELAAEVLQEEERKLIMPEQERVVGLGRTVKKGGFALNSGPKAPKSFSKSQPQKQPRESVQQPQPQPPPSRNTSAPSAEPKSGGSNTTKIEPKEIYDKAHRPPAALDETDYTQIPTLLDSRCLELDEDNAIRPTIINIGEAWKKSSQIALILPYPQKSILLADEQVVEKNKAFDLIDALSRSGALLFDDASLHVVVAATHSFQQTLINTIIQENQNPIEKMEQTTLIVGTIIHNKPVADLTRPEELPRIQEFLPVLFKSPSKQKTSKKSSSKVKKLKASSDKP